MLQQHAAHINFHFILESDLFSAAARRRALHSGAFASMALFNIEVYKCARFGPVFPHTPVPSESAPTAARVAEAVELTDVLYLLVSNWMQLVQWKPMVRPSGARSQFMSIYSIAANAK